MHQTMMRRSLIAIGLGLLPLLAETTGGVSGIVKDPAGAPIRGARVTVTNESKGLKSSAATNKEGFYSFLTPAAGTYELGVEADGFKPLNREIVVHVDSMVQMDLSLEPT